MKPCSRARFMAPRLLLPAILLMTFSHWAEAKNAKMLDLADTLATNRILTKLAQIVEGSDMAAFLSSRGPFTFFAPTDAAFAKLPPDTLDILLQPQNKERLQHILLFHVVNGKKLFAKDLSLLPSLLSCEGNPLPIKTSKYGTQFVLKAKIVHADIRCTNGVIHEVDTVLMPPESSLPPLAPPPPPSPPAPPPESVPATNAPPSTNAPADSSTETNTAPAANSSTNSNEAPAAVDTNAAPLVPVTPAATPETSPH